MTATSIEANCYFHTISILLIRNNGDKTHVIISPGTYCDTQVIITRENNTFIAGMIGSFWMAERKGQNVTMFLSFQIFDNGIFRNPIIKILGKL